MNIIDGAPAIAWVLIPIRKADGSVRAVAIIDREDARLTGYRWYYTDADEEAAGCSHCS